MASTAGRVGDGSRDELTARIVAAVYASSSLAVFFHTLVAARVGLGATEEKALLLLGGVGPLTAGELAQRIGLTSAATTSLIDRLEARGFVHRVRDTRDRRRVIVEPDAERLAALDAVFRESGARFDDLLGAYDAKELRAIASFVEGLVTRAREAMSRLGPVGPGIPEERTGP